MKRIFTIFAAALAFAGCSQDEVVTPTSNIEKPTFYATFADAETDSRTYLDAELKLLWHNDDRISLFTTTYNEQYKFVDETGKNSGAFEAVDSDSWVTGNAVSTNYAVYPYQADNALSNSEVLTIHFPAEQTYAEDSFGRGANTMVAATASTSSKLLPFRNAGGYLVLKLYGEGATVKSIELKGNKEEVISGAATAVAKYGYLPEITMGTEGGTTITLTVEDEAGVTLGATEAEATIFWIVVPPITFEEGFTITVTDTNGNTFTKSTTKQSIIERNEVRSMSALESTFEGKNEYPEVPEDPETTGPANNEIWYTNGSTTKATTPYNIYAFGANIVSNTYDAEKECWVITFDGEVTSIGEMAFYYWCTSLTSVTIPDSVTSIGLGAFFYCTSLTSVTIGNGVTSIGDSAFYGCSSLTSVTISDGVTSIGSSAFSFCSSLTSVTIPDSVTSVGDGAFSSSPLTAFYGKFASADNRCLIVDSRLMAFAPADCSSYTIPDSVTSIGDLAFNDCTGLTSVTIPDSVTSIGKAAFQDCTSLTSVTIPDSVTSIGDYAFLECSSLTSITIGNGVTSIGDSAFYHCYSLTSVFCKPTTPPTCGSNAFSNSLSKCKICVPTNSVSAYKSAQYWSDNASRIVGYDF